MNTYEIIEENSGGYFMENGPVETLEEADVIIQEGPEAAGSFAVNAVYEGSRNSWSANEEKCLLAAYKEEKHLFDGTSCKNDRAWVIIKEKWKITGFQDNNNKSGAARATFEHQEWFEETFGRDHDIAPIAYAESSRFTHIAPSTSLLVDDLQEDSPSVPKKRKRLHSEKFATILEDISKDNKKYREQRLLDKAHDREQKLKFHQECIASVNNATEVFRTTMEKLIDKL